jgi:hypothetical protein
MEVVHECNVGEDIKFNIGTHGSSIPCKKLHTFILSAYQGSVSLIGYDIDEHFDV